VMGELRTATTEAREAAATALSAQQAVEDTSQRLATQAARSGRLTVTLRQAFTRLEQQASVLEERAKRIGVEEKVYDANAPARLRERSRALAEVLDENRSAIAEVRNTLTTARPAGKSPQLLRTKLAEHVNSLSSMINDARSIPA